MKVRRGDVVIINHPFSDATGAKVRPAVVVQCDTRNAILTETVIVLVSKNLKHIATDATQLSVRIVTPEGRASGLRVDSVVKCGKLFTIHEDMIHKKIGYLSPSLMRQVTDCLKAALAIT